MMRLNKNKIEELLSFLFKTFFLIVGLNILLTSIYLIINEDFNKDNLKSEINLNIKKN